MGPAAGISFVVLRINRATLRLDRLLLHPLTPPNPSEPLYPRHRVLRLARPFHQPSILFVRRATNTDKRSVIRPYTPAHEEDVAIFGWKSNGRRVMRTLRISYEEFI